jgi:hypothetical protein
MENFDLKAYLRNNKLLNEGVEEIEETVEEASCGSKMKRSELKEKIREEILEAMKSDEEDDDMDIDTLQHMGIPEAEGDEEDAPEADIDIDADVDIEEPVSDEDDPFGDVEDDVEGAEKEAYDGIIAAGRAYKKLGEDPDNGGLKTMMDQLTYLERSYNYPPKEDVFNADSEI